MTNDQPIPPVLEAGDRLLTDPEGAALYAMGITRFRGLQALPDFPPPIWFGPRTKRHSERRLLEFAARLASRTPPGTAEARRIAARRQAKCEVPA